MPKKKTRTYSLEVVAGDYSFYREGRIMPHDDEPGWDVARVCRKIIRDWTDAKFEDRRDIVIHFVPSKQKD